MNDKTHHTPLTYAPLLLVVLIALGLLGAAVPRTAAQTPGVWETADAIRSAGQDAQTALYAAARADDPAEAYADAAAQIESAQALYNDHLSAQIEAAAPEASVLVQDALARARTAAEAGDGPALAAARGQIWTGLLWASYDAALAAVDAGDPDAANDWLRLREYRQATKVSVVDNPAAQAIAALNAGTITPDAARETVGNDLRDAYFFRLRDALSELEDTASKEFTVRSAEWAGELRGYFALLRSDFAAKQGEDAAAALDDHLRALEAAAIAGEWETVAAEMDAVQTAIASYQPVVLDADALAQRAQLLHTFVNLIYTEYKDGVRNGEIALEIEYREAVTFRDQAAAAFQELRPAIASADPDTAERIETLLAELDTRMAALDDPQTVQTLVAETSDLVERTLSVSAASDDSSAFVVIDTLLTELVQAVEQGDYAEADRLRLEAYAMYDSGPELRLAHRAPRLGHDVESLFWEGTSDRDGLGTLIDREAPAEDVQATVTHLNAKLDEAKTFLDQGVSAWLAMLNSAAIIIREGLEAVLVIGAILGYMRATKSPRKFSAWVYAGVAAAIGLSLITWWAANRIITITTANRELIEGVASLIAVGVLFFVTNWLFHKTYVVDWVSFVREKVGAALTNGSALTMAGLGFTVVYREGFETVLFYQAMLFDAAPLPTLIGFVLGAAIIIVIAVLILRMSKRLPLKPFFTGTTAIMLLLAFNFTGAGIRELQEAGLIGATLLPIVPENLILSETLGLYPTLETILAQVIFVAAIVVTFSYSRWQGTRKASSQPAPSPSH
jgi:high-affinity iron transporter